MHEMFSIIEGCAQDEYGHVFGLTFPIDIPTYKPINNINEWNDFLDFLKRSDDENIHLHKELNYQKAAYKLLDLYSKMLEAGMTPQK